MCILQKALEKALDNIKHYVGECIKVKEWFAGLGKNVNERIQKVLNVDLEEGRGKILESLWKEKENKRGERIKCIEQFKEPI